MEDIPNDAYGVVTWILFQVYEIVSNSVSSNQICCRLRASVQLHLPVAVSAACVQSVIIFRTGEQTWIGQRACLPVSWTGDPQVVVTCFPHSTSIVPLLKVCVLKEKLGHVIKPHSWDVEAVYDSKWWKIFRCLYPKRSKEMWNSRPLVVCSSHSTNLDVTHSLRLLT